MNPNLPPLIVEYPQPVSKFLYKNLVCRFFHGTHRCYPEVWGRGLKGPWHCTKCHPCSEGVLELLDASNESKLPFIPSDEEHPELFPTSIVLAAVDHQADTDYYRKLYEDLRAEDLPNFIRTIPLT